jgi:hypothetical protein
VGKPHDTFAPLDPGRAREIELVIDNAAAQKSVVVIDPDQGVSGAANTSLVNANPNLNGQLRYNRHYH